MKRRHVLIPIFLVSLMVMALFTSCFLQTKEEQSRTRVERLYDGFHKSLRSGRLPADYGTEMLARPIDEKLLQDAASSYPKEKRGPFHFDTVRFSDDGTLAFISTEGDAKYAIAQHPDCSWWFVDDIYESPLVVKDQSVTRALRNQVRVPESWTVFAESQQYDSENVLSSTFYFIQTGFDEIVSHFSSLKNPGDTEEVDKTLGDVLFTFYSEDGKKVDYEVLVWELKPGINVVDMADFTRQKK